MKHLWIMLLVCGLAIPAYAAEISPPPVSGEAVTLMPDGMPSFGEGLWYIVQSAVKALRPDLNQSCRVCLSVIGITILISILNGMSGKTAALVGFAGVLAIATVLLGSVSTLIHTAADTVKEISDYGKLLLPVLTASLAAQGGATGSAALYTGTAFFDALLGTVIGSVLVPMVYMFLALSVGSCALGGEYLKKLQDLLKWFISWLLKTVLYVFTGYMSITGVISGGADKAALKATKLTISGAVPVVGGIMSDASETILVGAGVVKGAVGAYGMWAVIAITVLPFLRIGILYLLLRITGAVCSVFSAPKIVELLQCFTDAMGFLLGMTGTVSLLFMISIVCFLRGTGV